MTIKSWYKFIQFNSILQANFSSFSILELRFCVFILKLFSNILKEDVPGVHLGNTVTIPMVLFRVNAILVTCTSGMEQIVQVNCLIVLKVHLEILVSTAKLYGTNVYDVSSMTA